MERGSVLHPSVEVLMSEAREGESAYDIVRRKAREIISKHRNFWQGPPFCPFLLADLEGIIVQKAPCDIKSDGRIFPVGEQVYIQYTEGQCQERIRFTIFHELAHTLFTDCYKRERRRSPVEKAEWEFENLCNTAASEFLFPLEEFSADVIDPRLGASAIKDLAERYVASIDATSRRYVGLLDQAACVLFAEYKEPEKGKVVSLFTRYAVPNTAFRPSFFKGFKINSKSIANKAHRTQVPLGAKSESWMVSGQWCRFQVEAIPLPKFQSKETSDLAIILYPQ
jgi:hypothetical protein